MGHKGWVCEPEDVSGDDSRLRLWGGVKSTSSLTYSIALALVSPQLPGLDPIWSEIITEPM